MTPPTITVEQLASWCEREAAFGNTHPFFRLMGIELRRIPELEAENARLREAVASVKAMANEWSWNAKTRPLSDGLNLAIASAFTQEPQP